MNACTQGNQTQYEAKLCQFQTNWRAAKEIEDKLPKEPPSPTYLANNAVKALNEIKQSLATNKEPCKEDTEANRPVVPPSQADSESNKQVPDEANRQKDR